LRRPACHGAGERGQAQIEVVAGAPLLLAAGLIVLQLLTVGYAQSLADGAAEAGAIAFADGRDPERAVRRALPGWARERIAIEAVEGEVAVRLRPPVLLPVLSGVLRVGSRAWARPAHK
jgi:hypothetical protein